MNETLYHWNQLDPLAAAAEILPTNGSAAWAAALAAARPIPDEASLFAAADRIWLALPQQDWLQAFATHPRIGERHAAASAKSLAWSSAEQKDALAGDAFEAEQLALFNREYEARFGRTFLVCATGRTRPEILELLKARLTSTDAEELEEAAEQQRQITHLRLERWLKGEQ